MRIAPVSMPNTNRYQIQNKKNISFGKIEEGEGVEDTIKDRIKYKYVKKDLYDYLAKTDLVTLKKGLLEPGSSAYLSANREAIEASPKKDRINYVLGQYRGIEMEIRVREDKKLDAMDPGFITKLDDMTVNDISRDLQTAESDEEDPVYEVDKRLERAADFFKNDDTGPLKKDETMEEKKQWMIFGMLGPQ